MCVVKLFNTKLNNRIVEINSINCAVYHANLMAHCEYKLIELHFSLFLPFIFYKILLR